MPNTVALSRFSMPSVSGAVGECGRVFLDSRSDGVLSAERGAVTMSASALMSGDGPASGA